MADRPILFSAPMVRTLLDGRKTQTRRILKPQPNVLNGGLPLNNGRGAYSTDGGWKRYPIAKGDRLWVRESWKPHSTFDHLPPREMPKSNVFYLADDKYSPSGSRVRPGIHMPRWASRITLIVTDVRVERLQAINEEDAVAEGIERLPNGLWSNYGQREASHEGFEFASNSYRALWNTINGPDAWEANPWVVAYTFTVELGNIDQIGDAA